MLVLFLTISPATIWILMKKSHSVVDPDYMTFVSRSGSVDLVEWSYGNIRVLIQGKKLDFDPAKSTRDYHNAAFAGFRAAIDEKMRHIY